jgi:Zn-dependent M32 family carboxypeptidase
MTKRFDNYVNLFLEKHFLRNAAALAALSGAFAAGKADLDAPLTNKVTDMYNQGRAFVSSKMDQYNNIPKYEADKNKINLFMKTAKLRSSESNYLNVIVKSIEKVSKNSMKDAAQCTDFLLDVIDQYNTTKDTDKFFEHLRDAFQIANGYLVAKKFQDQTDDTQKFTDTMKTLSSSIK